MYRIKEIKIDVKLNSIEYLKEKIAKKLHLKVEDIVKMNIIRRSIDARKKTQIFYVYEVDIDVTSSANKKDLQESPREEYKIPQHGEKQLTHRPVIIGSGPTGLFAGYLLAKEGYRPIILERGERIEERIQSVEKFWQTNNLNPESNVQFGEGGAGTFSDGKLNTTIHDKAFRGKKVLEIFASCGAKEEILYDHHPHIGTDKLREVIKNLRNQILRLGGEIRYQSKLTDIIIENEKLKKIEINHSEFIDTEILILAIGHSARDTFEMLNHRKIKMESKPFAVGLRVMHAQEKINLAQYGEYAKYLPPANYKLTYQTMENRGVYSFCMCPGGYVVNASSEPKHLTINGMSEEKRDTLTANAAIVVTVFQKDYGEGLFAGMEFQRKLEAAMYKIGNGKIPVQLYKDFLNHQKSTKFGNVIPLIKGKYVFSDFNEYLPEFILKAIKEAMPEFGKKIHCFDEDDVIFLGIESRTSSPIRILREENYNTNIAGIFPCGEGAGYAGGIVSSAIDGLKCAEKIISQYQPF